MCGESPTLINIWLLLFFENLYVFTCFGFYAICLHLLGNQLHSRVNQNSYTMAFIKVLKFSKTVSKVCKAGVCSTRLEKHDFSLQVSICFNNHTQEQEPFLLYSFTQFRSKNKRNIEIVSLRSLRRTVMCHHPKTQSRSILSELWLSGILLGLSVVCLRVNTETE